jgi:hypothetical protein
MIHWFEPLPLYARSPVPGLKGDGIKLLIKLQAIDVREE